MKKLCFIIFGFGWSLNLFAQFPAPYCAENYSTAMEPITLVDFSNIHQTSPSEFAWNSWPYTNFYPHEDYTAVIGNVTKGNTYTLAVQGYASACCGGGVLAFFDWNNDGDFIDTGEKIAIGILGNSTGTDGVQVSKAITIPTTAITGNVRMRIAKKRNGYQPNICNIDGYGQAEDYTLNVSAPVCSFPDPIVATNITTTSATLSWTAISGVLGYEYVLDQTATDPTGAGTLITTTSYNAASLTTATVYYFHIRTKCSASFSLWKTFRFGTLIDCSTATSISNCGVAQAYSLGAGYGVYDQVTTSCGFTSLGKEKLYSFTPSVSGTYTLNHTVNSNWVDYFYTNAANGCGSTSWNCINRFSNTGTKTFGPLSAATTYYFLVDAEVNSFGAVGSFTITCPTAPANDNATGAVALIVGSACTGASYTNDGATKAANEPTNCNGTANSTVWYKFTAPASGAVRISTDVGAGNTLVDSRIALYSSTNVNDYVTFTNIACDEDGGSVLSSGKMAVVYATGLTSGQTYYIQVGGAANTTTSGTFCLQVEELTSTMLSTTNTCASFYQTPVGSASYTGQIPLLDASSKLVAIVKNSSGGAANAFNVAQNINTGIIRQDVNGLKYLNRNFRISNATATNVEVQLFFLTTELNALITADATSVLSSLGVTRQTESVAGCYNNFSASNGVATFIAQTSNATLNETSWIKFITPGFSNFYINKGPSALPVTLISFTGTRNSNANNLLWKVANEINLNKYEIESSKDGVVFSTVGTVAATNLSTYYLTDNIPNWNATGTIFYRLKMIDKNGSYKYSNTIKFNIQHSTSNITVFPNPTKDVITISNVKLGDEIKLYDAQGKLMQKIKVTANAFTMDISKYSRGIYFIKTNDGVVEKIIKE